MKIFKLFLTLVLSLQTLNASDLPSDKQLQKMIGRMLLVGFSNESIDKNSEIVRHIKQYELGGVILFDRFYSNRSKTKNISSPKQLQNLTSKLKSFSNKPLIISVDQEGGKVARLKPAYGFTKIPSAKQISTLHVDRAKGIYKTQAQMLQTAGINCDFAPVVDLAVNPKNKVIYGLERSYGADTEEVVKYAKIFIDSLKNEKIISVLKHFPGHGSSLGDSHKGFVDISNTWNEIELEPYKELIKSNAVSMIMTAHVFNSHLDKKYPATLSYNVNTKLLREKLGYKGVVISDDLQMKAISKHYTLEQIVTLAINSGVDMLLFGNQLAEQNIDELVEVIAKQVKNGAISMKRILESNKRLEQLHKRRLAT
ncbi:MAG: glycoside hydrolase family 3 protein [Sulfurimonas sp.]|nr:glycoside hydrolase family 3 protein [Sulfurimonas sp.]